MPQNPRIGWTISMRFYKKKNRQKKISVSLLSCRKRKKYLYSQYFQVFEPFDGLLVDAQKTVVVH